MSDYTRITFVDDTPPAVDADNLNHMDQGIDDAHAEIAAIDTRVTAIEGGGASFPAGFVAPYAGANAPSGWLVCDGSAVSRAAYSALHGLLRDAGGANTYVYGSGDGTTTFNLPDLRGRFPVGKGSHADVDTLGDNDGTTLASRRPKHKHTAAGHTHVQARENVSLTPGGTTFSITGNGSSVDGPQTGSTTTQVGPQTGAEPLDTVPFLTLNYIVKT